MSFIFLGGFEFLNILFSSMTKIQSFGQFMVGYFFNPVVCSHEVFLCPLAAFAYYVINHCIFFSPLNLYLLFCFTFSNFRFNVIGHFVFIEIFFSGASVSLLRFPLRWYVYVFFVSNLSYFALNIYILVFLPISVSFFKIYIHHQCCYWLILLIYVYSL